MVTRISVFGKLFRATVVSVAVKPYNQLKFLNLVTMATIKDVKKAVLDAYKDITIRIPFKFC